MSLAYSLEIIGAAKRLNDELKTQIIASLVDNKKCPPTGYMSAEYFRLRSLQMLGAANHFPVRIEEAIDACATNLDTGYCDFAMADKRDAYMGTAKRTARDKPIHSPLSACHVRALAEVVGNNSARDRINKRLEEYSSHLKKQPMDIPAFQMRDVPIPFGADKTPIEVLCASDLIQNSLTIWSRAQTLLKKKSGVLPPLFLINEHEAIKLEIKPYIQPFERELAMRELQALLSSDERCTEEQGYWLVHTKRHESYFQERLTYWQRVGQTIMTPTLQTALEQTQNGFQGINGLHHSRRLRYGPHDLHEYRGKFFPQLVRSLITIADTPETGIVFDPMCGSGTTLCEAIAFGRSAIGADLNPLSVLISRVKATIPTVTPEDFRSQISDWLNAVKYEQIPLEQIWNSTDLAYLLHWFNSQALVDLARVLAEINRLPEGLNRDFLLVCLSDIVRSVSWQKATDLRVRKEVRSYEPGLAIKRFIDKVSSQVERIHAYLSVLPHYDKPPSLYIREGNSIEIDRLFPEFRGCVDVLITSPPYATALPYLDTDRLSLVVIGLLSRTSHKSREALMIGTREVTERQRKEDWEWFQSRKSELPEALIDLIEHIALHYHPISDTVGFRRRNLPALLAKYFLNMLDAMRAAHLLMRPGSCAFYAVGNNSTEIEGERQEIATNRFLFDIGAVAGWHQDGFIDMELLPSRDIFKDNRGSRETILCFKA